MNSNLEYSAKQIKAATYPIDIFGILVGTTEEKLKALKHVFNPLVKIVFPESYINDPVSYAFATPVFDRLKQFKDLAEKQIKNGTYGEKPEPITITSQGKKYELNQLFKSGDIADTYIVGSNLLKIARHQVDDDLMVAEEKNLKKFRDFIKLKEDPKLPSWLLTVPEIKHSFKLNPSKQRVNIMDYHAGFISGEDVFNAIGPINSRTFVWMFKRLLNLVDWIGHSGLVHGAILPPHVLFFPDNCNNSKNDIRKHSCHMVDWCYSVNIGKRLRAFSSPYFAFYPPEVKAKQEATHATDLFMMAKTMLFLIGGDVVGNVFPTGFPKLFENHLRLCLLDDPLKRIRDSRKYFNEFTILAQKEFGPSKWSPFEIPGVTEVL